MEGLKQKTIRAGSARLVGQLSRALLRLASIVILARLLDPQDFGLFAMVAVLTGVFEIFATGGLSLATIQKAEVTDEQLSTMFWCNLATGLCLALLCLTVAAPLGAFYQEPRVSAVLAAMAPAFILTGAGAQHIAVLQRHMRHATLSAIEVGGEATGLVVGVAMALAGYGAWSLVGAALIMPLVITAGVWMATRWIPGRPRWSGEVSDMLRFGGTLILNNLIIYAAYNTEKLLIGRAFGTSALGIYSRAYELVNLPTRIINSAFGNVTFAALSRIQDDPIRFKSYFLKGYALVLSITIPTTIFCAAFADDVILVMLGPKWSEAVPIFRLLSPTILVFSIINPFAWLLQSAGLHRRSLHLALVIAPLTVCAYFAGLPYGLHGVALAYSLAMTLWMFPHVVWCLHGTPISSRDLLPSIARPMSAGLVAGLIAAFVQQRLQIVDFAVLRLAISGAVMSAVYFGILLFVFKQRDFYIDLLRALGKPA